MTDAKNVLAIILLAPLFWAGCHLILMEFRQARGIYYEPKTEKGFCRLVARKAGCWPSDVWRFLYENKIQFGDHAYDWSELGAELIANELKEDR